MRIRLLIIALIGLGIASCEVKPKPIAYGVDGCQYCSMTIVDRQHAAELLTRKGRAYKFDAVECMLNYRAEMEKEDIGLLLCNPFEHPEELIDATGATYLISDALPSPMGAFLTAFEERDAAEETAERLGGSVFSWEELLNHWKEVGYVQY